VSLYLVRHAHALARHDWRERDADRPLSARGKVQAGGLAAALAGRPLRRALSSPALRCQQTVAALAAAHDLPVELLDMLAEGAPPAPARALLDELAAAGIDAVVCSHGDLIPDLLAGLRREGLPIEGEGCAKGSVWQLHTADGRIVSARYHRHPHVDAKDQHP
jgi:8-oxo-dGTP diphosphatase